MSRFEAFDLHLNDVADIEISAQLFDRALIQDYSRQAYVERQVHTVFPVIFDEGLDDRLNLELLSALDVTVDKGILGTEGRVTHDLVENGDLLKKLVPVLVELVDDFQVTILALHTLIHLRKVEYILCCILDHILRKRALLPECFIASHFLMNFLLFGVRNIDIVLEQQCKRDVIVIVIGQFLRPILGLLNDPVRDLRVEHEIADEIVLVNQRALVLAEIVEDFHDRLGLHDLLESINEGVHRK